MQFFKLVAILAVGITAIATPIKQHGTIVRPHGAIGAHRGRGCESSDDSDLISDADSGYDSDRSVTSPYTG
ncbi:hypothetical protein PgNI_10319 [Pyricularia grisea]|uniref:Uncharacterized protein n=1 Tax=Pyricularia grisea TaxID=148305 RepID=A0A6P8AZQ7_PYRGI|nr:hypothetical protein PgNI_10319 [Pyricularia grisea]TLD07794.1 hypothetical protein PgNI_10319 [Pyricularia grisea]